MTTHLSRQLYPLFVVILAVAILTVITHTYVFV